ncbi:MAG: STAS/SEC14 domain-containing protein [Anaerolineae bacterium]
MGYKLSKITENIMRLDLIGDFDAEDASNYPAQLMPYLENAAAHGEQLHIYVDTSEFGSLSVAGRRVFSEANKDERQGKIAASGVNRFLGMMARFIMVASGRDNIRFFDDENSALEWLKGSD